MKKICYMVLCLVGVLFLTACSRKEGTEMNLFFINIDGNMLVQEKYIRVEESSEAAVSEVLAALRSPKDKRKSVSAFPEFVEVKEISIVNRKVEIVFNQEYLRLHKSGEILLRAAIVQSLAQLPDVSFVSFYIEEEPLKDSSGKIVGMMSAEDFVQNTGSSLKSYQSTDLKLYFVNSDGTKLNLEKRSDVKYGINTSIEKLVVEQLMKGTTSDKRQAGIQSTVKLLGVTVKDGICYVNFDSSFLTNSSNQVPEVTIYSIVNSIIANGNAIKVQILIDGSSDIAYLGSVDLREPLEWRADLLEE